jgi:RNA polymerase sigma-70 factor (ECF subfamily)
MRLDEIEMVTKAQLGDKQSLNRLAELARERLRVYVWRITLQDDITQEIVQETLLEMVKILGKLKRADRFWPWLYGIATNKLHRHHRTESVRRKMTESEARRDIVHKDRQEGLENLVGQELKEIVSGAMKKLKTRHKAVLIMRCYDGMSYAEIAESIGCSEFGTRMLFVRAKRALQKELLRNGFSKGTLLAALTFFGKMTAPSEAAAATVSVTAATTEVGLLAGVVGLATTKTAIVSLTAGGVLTAGAIMATHSPEKQIIEGAQSAVSPNAIGSFGQAANGSEQYWYYFPDGPAGTIMMRARAGTNGEKTSWQMLQNDRGNYYYLGDTIYINNHRMWAADLSVVRLPTDDPELSAFLSQVEGRDVKIQHVSGKGKGLLVVAARDNKGGDDRSWVIRHYNVLDEAYFQSDWPAGIRTIDNRDIMHKRGWTYFTVAGWVNGEKVTGVGQMPFVYAAGKARPAWLSLRIGNKVRIIDTGQEACVYGSDGRMLSNYRGGSFFSGLARPWMGLHTIDFIRRDAAQQRLRFQTNWLQGRKTAEVAVTCEGVRLVYTIDMDTDIIEKITFYVDRINKGELQFSYLQNLDGGVAFARPQVQGQREPQNKDVGMLWLTQLVDGSVGR